MSASSSMMRTLCRGPRLDWVTAGSAIAALLSKRLILFVHMLDHLALDHEGDHLGDVFGMVGDPFKVFRDEQNASRARDQPRVFGHVDEQLAIDLTIEAVDFV